MSFITASNLVKAISLLPRGQWFEYINRSTPTRIQVLEVHFPDGPIRILRYNQRTESCREAKDETISAQMLWRVANAVSEGIPFNLDRVLGGSYNTRSALETLLAHTPEFYWCKPGRIELVRDSAQIKDGHKHLVWLPGKPKSNGLIKYYESTQVISEIPAMSAVYEAVLPTRSLGLDIEVERRHLQVQIALALIGSQIGFRTWIARSDQGLTYGNRRVGEIDGVVPSLDSEPMIRPYEGALAAAMHIDCIWFQNGKLMPAVIEVEHSTGVVSGLARMLRLYNSVPKFETRWVIAAADEDRDKVVRHANEVAYAPMKIKFFSYSAIDELYAFCQRRRPTRDAVTEHFLDCFMENTISNS